MKQLYAMMTNECNLSCPHCQLHLIPEKYNRDKFIANLNSFDGVIILFGGEPTYHIDRMYDIIDDNYKNGKSKISSISTNLVTGHLDSKLIEYFKQVGYISTSWNPKRFTDEQYKMWLSNLDMLEGTGISCAVIITLTEDLITTSHIDEFLNIVDSWNCNSVKSIKFEHYIGEHSANYYLNADKWLCQLYNWWRSPIKVEAFDKNIPWYKDCKDIYTMQPNGNILKGCPNSLHAMPHVLTKCFTCDKVHECKPCVLQEGCSYPGLLRMTIEAEED